MYTPQSNSLVTEDGGYCPYEINISSAEKNLNVKASNYAHKPDL